MDSRNTIHFNPKFKNAHINPNFIQQPSKILINPRFLLQQQQNDYQSSNSTNIVSRSPEILPTTISPSTTAIIRNTRRTLIRAPAVSKFPMPSTSQFPTPPVAHHPINSKNLIKIGNNKLVTAAHLMNVQQKENEIIKSKTESLMKTKKFKMMETEPKSIYKLDRRQDSIGSRKKKIVRKYSIKRVEPKSPGSNKKSKMNTSIVNGFSPSKVINKSIYRSHLSAIKTRSISLLNKSSTRKSNINCPIFRRLGKCLAHKRGRCHKVHDKNYVIVCSKYLRGVCQDENCLLSHDTSYKKMPVCKYFLHQGLCHKEECLYLHKKLSDDVGVCLEFVKGYCAEGEKCKLLHDYPEAKSEDRKKFTIVRKKTDKSKSKKHEEIVSAEPSEQQHSRYFVNEEQPNERIIPLKKKFESLPSYIPL